MRHDRTVSHTWRDGILASFTSEIAAATSLTLVSDPDYLVTEQRALAAIQANGFDALVHDDPMTFRHTYERAYRSQWDAGTPQALVVILRGPVESAPHDVLERARRESRILTYSMGKLLPNLDVSVVLPLDRAHLQAVFDAHQTHPSQPRGRAATLRFVLHHVFQTTVDHIQRPPDLLATLFRLHATHGELPASLSHHLVDELRQSNRWDAWPLERIVPNTHDFLAFVDERWPRHVARVAGTGNDTLVDTSLAYDGPEDLPFDHDAVRPYVDTLFLDRKLTPVTVASSRSADLGWEAVGVAGQDERAATARMDQFLSRLASLNANADSSHVDWGETARLWAEITALRHTNIYSLDSGTLNSAHDTGRRLDAEFGEWVRRHYAALYALPYWPLPAMVHRVPHVMAHEMLGSPAGSTAKCALIIVDGLAWSHWIVLRDVLRHARRFRLEESGVFAWIPTLTAVSRQAIFAGQTPMDFGATIHRTDQDARHWGMFWDNHDVPPSAVRYILQKKQEAKRSFVERVRESAERPDVRVIGIVVGAVDNAVHGAAMGAGALHATVERWVQEDVLGSLISTLVSEGYRVYLTSDHGNTEATGMGKPNVGVTADERGVRAHIFPDEAARSHTHQEHPDAISWPPIGLPPGYYPLLAPDRRAFVASGTQTISHGGASLEELIVPFVRIGQGR